MRFGRNLAWLGVVAVAAVPLTVAAQYGNKEEAKPTEAKPVAATATATAAIDQKAPAFSLSGIDGKTYSLADFKGKYVVLEWNNFDCPFVKKFYGSGKMQELQKEYTDKGVVWLTICSSAEGKQGYYDAATLQTMNADRKTSPTAYLTDADGKVGKLYGAKTTPHIFIINPDGVLIYAGAIDDKPGPDPADIATANNYVVTSLSLAMSGKPVEVKSTQSYGCSVKYSN